MHRPAAVVARIPSFEATPTTSLPVRPECLFARPVRGDRVRIRSACHRIAPPPLARWVDARSWIRPREHASRTRSPRYPPAAASTARWVPSWLGGRGTHRYRRGGTEAWTLSEMRAIESCHSHENRQAPAFRSATEARRACARGLRCALRFTALHTLQRPARAPSRACSSPRWCIEPFASDASVTHPSSSGDFAPTLRKMDRDRSFRSFVKKERPSATRGAFHRSKTRDHDTLADALQGRCRAHGFATAIRPPTPIRPARSPALS
jgi:hypothetical protein